MASLQELINDRIGGSFASEESNLDDGQIFVYCSGREYGCFTNCFCWPARVAGTAKIEIWGAGGSVGCNCCCNYSVGGESGAYATKTILFGPNGYLCGQPGHPCMTNTAFCWPGCSLATCVTICDGINATATGCTCMCAEGGNGGGQWCRTSTSSTCCLQSCCYPGVPQVEGHGVGCGWVCGCRNTYHHPTAYGGTTNCGATFACTAGWTCDTSGNRNYLQHSNAIPFGQYSACKASAHVSQDNGDAMHAHQSGHGPWNQVQGKGSIHRAPHMGHPFSPGCWNGSKMCQCYEATGCVPYVPPGQGATETLGCPSVRAVGFRGGLGYVRITFKATTP